MTAKSAFRGCGPLLWYAGFSARDAPENEMRVSRQRDPRPSECPRRHVHADLGEYAAVALRLLLSEGDRKIMMKRAPPQTFMRMEQLPLSIKQRGIAV